MLIFCSQAWALEESYNKDRTFDVPYREQAVIISKDGFFPNRLVVFKGEKVRFFITAVGVDSACFNIPDKNVFSSTTSQKIAETETYFDKAGVFQFNCPNNTFSGRIMVIEKESDRLESQRRGLASDTVKVWRPKETPSEWVQIKREEFNRLRGMGDALDLDSNE
jgi:plastocyanin domain-containing protein